MIRNNLIHLFSKPSWVDDVVAKTECSVDFIAKDKNGEMKTRRSVMIDNTISTEEGDDLMVPTKAKVCTTWLTGRSEITIDFEDQKVTFFSSHQGDRGKVSEAHWILNNINDKEDRPIIFVEKDHNGVAYDVESCPVNDIYDTKDLINYVKTKIIDPIDQIFENNPGEDVFNYVTEDRVDW